MAHNSVLGRAHTHTRAEALALSIDDTSTGRYKIIEAKFFEGGDINFPTSRLKTTVDDVVEFELADNWIAKDVLNPNDALTRSVKAGSLNQDQADAIRLALKEGRVDKELVVVKNSLDGRTVANTLGSNPLLGTSSSNPVAATVVEIGEALPSP